MSDLIERFKKEFQELESKPVIYLELSQLQAWILMSNLQLALRHPDNKGQSSKTAIEIATNLQNIVASEGALKEVAEMGWLPEYDE